MILDHTQGTVDAADFHYAQYRTEDLFTGDLHAWGYIGEYGRTDEVTVFVGIGNVGLRPSSARVAPSF